MGCFVHGINILYGELANEILEEYIEELFNLKQNKMTTLKLKTIPKMWVIKQAGKKRKKWFKDGDPAHPGQGKHKLLSDYLKKPETESIIYPVKTIQDLLDKTETENPGYPVLKIYFADYNKVGSPISIPDDHDGTLTIIFAPAAADYSDFGTYYVIAPNDSVYAIPKATKDEWTKHYKEHKVPILNKTILLSNEENRSTVDGIYSDTLVIIYNKSDFENIAGSSDNGEIKYQSAMNSVDISFIRVDFAAHTNKGIYSPILSPQYGRNVFHNRLFLQFEYLLKNRHTVFYIDDQDDFPDRLNIGGIGTSSLSGQKKSLLTFDNGQLCPPTCK